MARAGNCEYALDCNLQSMSIEEVIARLIVVDSNGCYHVNAVLDSGDCSTISVAATCGNNESWIDLIKKTIVLDDCGNWAISFFSSTLQ